MSTWLRRCYNKQKLYVFIEKSMKYLIYTSLSYNSHDFQNKDDFGSGDFQYTCLLASRAHVHDLLLVSVLVRKSNLNSLIFLDMTK